MKTIVKVVNDDGREINNFEFKGVVLCHEGNADEIMHTLTSRPASTKTYLLIELEPANLGAYSKVYPG